MLLAQKAVRPALPAAPFPDWLEPIVRRIRSRIPQLARYAPNEVNAIWYERERGDCLSAHVDQRDLSGDVIINLSLAGACTMTYRDTKSGAEYVRVHLPRRCLQVQSAGARYSYTHEIMNADLEEPRRVSLTMRESAITGFRV